MLAIRMQRLGRKGHPTYRVVVQDSRQAPTSGKTVASIGSYDPHTKTTTLVKEKAEFYLEHGAQPSPRVVNLFVSEGVKLPSWVKTEKVTKTRSLRNPDKLRKNRPAEEAPVEAEAPAEEPVTAEDTSIESTDAEVTTDTPTEDTKAEAATEEKAEATDEKKS